jgi:superfamily II DNA or RNA helicase
MICHFNVNYNQTPINWGFNSKQMKLRPYQEELLSEILEKIPKVNRLCVQLSTGGGKTVIFTELINRLNSKTLILVDSIDLVNQTIATFEKKGLDIGAITAGNKKIPENKIIVAMVTTLHNRVKKDAELLHIFKYCIIDECHVWIFNKLFAFMPKTKIIGFTATPVRLKRYKISENETALECMSDVYDEIVCGKPIQWLIDNNYLVRDENIRIDFNSSGLKTDSSGEFTVASMKKVFQHEDYQNGLYSTYLNHALGKKTMIFTASTETNEIYSQLFRKHNVKTYDSVNNNANERDEIIEWFRNASDAVLINTGCFTKGFDVCDVECIIVARATMSLALWIQIVGRGSRPTNKIYKDNILVIDGGNNIDNHGTFSFDRNWYKLFSDKQIRLIIEPQQECDSCGYTFDEKEKICPNCGHEIESNGEKKEVGEKKFVILGEKIKPQPPKIDINFCINKGYSKYDAIKILTQKWVKFISIQEIEEKSFLHHWQITNQFLKRFNVLLRPYYFEILNSILSDGKHVTYSHLTENILKKSFEKKYGTDKI